MKTEAKRSTLNTRALYCTGLISCFLIINGCGPAVHQSAPVDAVKAQDVLKDVLERWKGGEIAEDLQDGQPPIIVQDFDWIGGAKLLNFEVLDEGKPVDANLVAKVKLTIEDKKGAKTDKTVTYLVGTAPRLTVFRDSFN